MAHLIVVPKLIIENFEMFMRTDNLWDPLSTEKYTILTAKTLEHLRQHDIEPRRGDIVYFTDENKTKIVKKSKYYKFEVINYKRNTIYDGILLQHFQYNSPFAGVLPCTYQFPDFPINYWLSILGIYHNIWFDYRPYREAITRNMTNNIPDELFIDPTNRYDDDDLYTWFTMGLDVKIHFIIIKWPRQDIDDIKYIFDSDDCYAIGQLERGIVPKTFVRTLAYEPIPEGQQRKYVSSDNIIIIAFSSSKKKDELMINNV
jgi:hypothetical protein